MKTAFLMLFLGVIDLPCNLITTPDYSAIADPQERWNAYGITSYTIRQRANCFCPNGGTQMRLTVRNNRLVNVQYADFTTLPREHWLPYKTVDELFAVLRRADQGTVLFAEYDSIYGYPTNFFIDPIKEAVDDEFGYETGGFRRMQ